MLPTGGMVRLEEENAGEVSRYARRSESLRDLVRVALAVFCLGVGGLVVASAFPERRRLHEKEGELFEVMLQEAKMREEKRVCETLHRALSEEDQGFFEAQARDRLGRCRAGERVFRFDR